MIPRLYGPHTRGREPEPEPGEGEGEGQPAAVTRVLLHALTVRRPRARYSVTWITKLFMFLKWIMPVSCMDHLIMQPKGLAPLPPPLRRRCWHNKLHP